MVCRTRGAVLLVVLCLAACQDDERAPAPHHHHRAAGASDASDASDAADPDAAAIDVPRSDGTNETFEAALRLDVHDQGRGLRQDIRGASQVDFFVFEASEGEFYEIATSRGSFGPDTIITIFDGDRQLVAQNDDGPRFPGDAIDARVVLRAAHGGDYYVQVVDPFTPPAVFTDPGISSFDYRVWARALDADTSSAAHGDHDSPREVSFEHDDPSGYECATLIGELADGTTDLFSLRGKAEHALIGHVHASGAHGDGSTAKADVVSVSDEEHHELARIERAGGQDSIHPPVGKGAYEVAVHGSGEPGANGYYALDLVLLPDNPREIDDEANGAPNGAERIELSGSPQRRGLVLSTLPADDVDYYEFDVMPGELVQVACEGQSGGSGVRRLRAELTDESGATLLAAVERPDRNLELDPLEITSASKLYLRLSSESAAAVGSDGSEIEPWTRCVVFAAQP